MHRQPLIDLLVDYHPDDAQEIAMKKEMLAFVRENERCFERSLDIGHVTASAWLLNEAGTHALLMHHLKLDCWLQVGGHCDGNPDVLAVAIKEAQEESGIEEIRCVSSDIFDLHIHIIPQYKNIPPHKHYDVRFLLQSGADDQLSQNHESTGLIWIAKDGILPTSERSILRMYEKWITITAVPA